MNRKLEITVLDDRIAPAILHSLNVGLEFGPGEDPTLGPGQFSVSEAAERLTALAPFTEGMRTFTCTNDYADVSRLIHDLHKTAYIGAWIGSDDAANYRELDALIAQGVLGYVDVAIVGSETQLRFDHGYGNAVGEAKLIEYLDYVKTAFVAAGLNIPVVTADTYDRFFAHPNLLSHVDQVWGNFYPYWEGVDVATAVTWLNYKHSTLKAFAGETPVIVSEAGWPSDGQANGAAVPSPENAAFYFRQVTSWAKANHVDLNYFEAVDEPWKNEPLGVGAHWGIFSFDVGLHLKPGMQAAFDDASAATWINFFTMTADIQTNLSTFVISGSAMIGANVTVNGTPIPAAEIDETGAFVHTFGLANGNNTLTVSITGLGGQIVASATKTVNYDPNYSTATSTVVYAAVTNPALNGTVAIDTTHDVILGLIPSKRVLAVSPTRREVYFDDGSVYSTITNQLLRMLQLANPILQNGFLISPDGNRIYAGDQVIDVSSNTVVATLPVDITTGNAYAGVVPGGPTISADGIWIYACKATSTLVDQTLYRINTTTGAFTATTVQINPWLSDLALSPDQTTIIVSSYGGFARFFDSTTLAELPSSLLGADYSGRIVALTSTTAAIGWKGNPYLQAGRIQIVDLTTRSLIQELPEMLSASLAVSPGMNELFTSSGWGSGILDFSVAASGSLSLRKFFGLSVNSYVKTTGLHVHDDIPRIAVKLAAPMVTGVAPFSGPTTGGITAVITGTGFVPGQTTVTFGSAAATIESMDSTHITVIAPAAVAGTVEVVVTTPAGSSAAIGTTHEFTYQGPPVLLSTILNGNDPRLLNLPSEFANQRSMVRSFQLTFDKPVVLTSSAVRIGIHTNPLIPNPTLPLLVSILNNSGGIDLDKIWNVTFSGDNVVGGSIGDGEYDLNVDSALVTDAYGQHLDPAPATFTFYRLLGDSDGNRTVNNLDIVYARRQLGRTQATPNYLWLFDTDWNGTVDNDDITAFRREAYRTI